MENFNFTNYVNDGVRLWIDDVLLIDSYENDDQESEFLVYSAITPYSFAVDKLVSLKLEYRENRGNALIKLFWESPSQPFEVIPSNRLSSHATDISESPFTVYPIGIEPSAPETCQLSIFDWDKLLVSWGTPINDGGEEVTSFLIEYWNNINGTYGISEIKQLRLDAAQDSFFVIGSASESYHTPLSVNMTAFDLKKALESMPSIGQVTVTRSITSESVDFTIEYNTDVAPVSELSIKPSPFSPYFYNGLCICEGGQNICSSGAFSIGCDSSNTRSGSILTSKIIVDSVETYREKSGQYQHIIGELVQDSSITDGFGVRVSARNSLGYSLPCPSLFLKPKGVPDPPLYTEVVRVPGSASDVRMYFSSVSFPANKASSITGFLLEWSPSIAFDIDISQTSLELSSLERHRLGGYNKVNEIIYDYVIGNLRPGVSYYVRVGAINEMGNGRMSEPVHILPGSSPGRFEEEPGVSLDTIKASKVVSVNESSSTLQVSWKKPPSDNGFEIKSYLIEYWTSPGVWDVQEIQLQGASEYVEGTFTLSYGDDKTDSLDIDSSATQLQIALEQLSAIRSIQVDKVGINPNHTWIVTFLSEFPTVVGEILRIDELTNIFDTGGNHPFLTVSVKVEGSLPENYATLDVSVDDINQAYYSKIISNLIPGQTYSAQVSALNEMGLSKPHSAIPDKLAPPKQKPSEPLDTALSLLSGSALLLSFSDPESNGGDTITKFKVEWDFSDSFNSMNESPAGSYTKFPEASLYGCHPCTHIISGLETGKNVFARVYAYNSFGFSSQPGVSKPLSPKTQAAPPTDVTIVPQSSSSLLVSFSNPMNNGGQQISMFKIEWTKMGFHLVQDENYDTLRSVLFARHAVQTITSSSERNNLQGTFRISFDGHETPPLHIKASANEMQAFMEELPTVGSVSVSRYPLGFGHVWAITFFNLIGNEDWFGDLPMVKVSVDDEGKSSSFVDDTYGGSGSLNGTDPYLFVKYPVRQYNGYEQQMLQSKCSSSGGTMSGFFTVSFEGKLLFKSVSQIKPDNTNSIALCRFKYNSNTAQRFSNFN